MKLFARLVAVFVAIALVFVAGPAQAAVSQAMTGGTITNNSFRYGSIFEVDGTISANTYYKFGYTALTCEIYRNGTRVLAVTQYSGSSTNLSTKRTCSESVSVASGNTYRARVVVTYDLYKVNSQGIYVKYGTYGTNLWGPSVSV